METVVLLAIAFVIFLLWTNSEILKELLQEEKSNGKTILITTHIMQFVEEMADEIIYLLEGNIYFKGSIQKLIKSTKQEDFQHAIALISKSTQHV